MFWLTFWSGSYIWSFPYTFGLQMRHIWTLRPGSYTEFRYTSLEHSGLSWGAIFGKVTKYTENTNFSTMGMSENQEMIVFQEQKPRRVLQDIEGLFRIYR